MLSRQDFCKRLQRYPLIDYDEWKNIELNGRNPALKTTDVKKSQNAVTATVAADIVWIQNCGAYLCRHLFSGDRSLPFCTRACGDVSSRPPDTACDSSRLSCSHHICRPVRPRRNRRPDKPGTRRSQPESPASTLGFPREHRTDRNCSRVPFGI